jgi:hypothetical protein
MKNHLFFLSDGAKSCIATFFNLENSNTAAIFTEEYFYHRSRNKVKPFWGGKYRKSGREKMEVKRL